MIDPPNGILCSLRAKCMGPMAANWFQFHCGQANWFVRFLPCNLEHEVLIQQILGVPHCQSNSNDPVADIWNYILIHKFSDGKNSTYTVYRIPHKAVETIAPKCQKPKSQEIIPNYNIFAFHNSPNYIYNIRNYIIRRAMESVNWLWHPWNRCFFFSYSVFPRYIPIKYMAIMTTQIITLRELLYPNDLWRSQICPVRRPHGHCGAVAMESRPHGSTGRCQEGHGFGVEPHTWYIFKCIFI